MNHRNDASYAPPDSVDSLRAELAKASKKIDDDAIERRRLEIQVTDLQRRGNELLAEARAARGEAKALRKILDALIGVFGEGDMRLAAERAAERSGT